MRRRPWKRIRAWFSRRAERLHASLGKWQALWEALQGTGSFLTFLVSVGALVFVVIQLGIQRKDFEFRLNRVVQDAKEKDEAFAAERLRFQNGQTSRMIDDMNQVNMLWVQFPYITEYHEKAFSPDPKEETAARCKRLRAQFAKEQTARKQIILASCEMLANFMDAAILQRDSLDPGDWNRWWNSFMDNYDENPILQDFLEVRRDWYKSREALFDKQQRFDYYCDGEYRRTLDHSCFK